MANKPISYQSRDSINSSMASSASVDQTPVTREQGDTSSGSSVRPLTQASNGSSVRQSRTSDGVGGSSLRQTNSVGADSDTTVVIEPKISTIEPLDMTNYYHPYCYPHVMNWTMGEDSISDMTSAYIAETKSMDNGMERHQGKPLPFMLEQTDGIFALLIFCFLFFAHIYNGGIGFLKDNFLSLFSGRPGGNSYRQNTTKDVLYSYFLIFQVVVLFAIATYDVLMLFDPLEKSVQTPFQTILLFSLFIFICLFIKLGFYKLMGYIFDSSSGMRYLSHMYIINLEILGIFYFIPTLLLIYSDYWNIYIIGFMLILLIIIHLMFFYKLIMFFISEKLSFLYLIVYLCTIEILPYVFLIGGLVYLYKLEVSTLVWFLK